MSGQGNRPQPPSGDKAPPKRTAPASRDPLTRAASSSLVPRLNLSNLALTLPYKLELPLQLCGRVGPQLSGAPDPQHSRGAGPGPGRAASLQPSQGVGPHRLMDQYRFGLIKEIVLAQHSIKRGQKLLSLTLSDDLKARGINFINQATERGRLLINDGKERTTRLVQNFRYSYSPFLRDAETPGLLGQCYILEITQVFQNEADPIKRLQIFQARLDSFKSISSDSDDLIDLFCAYALVVDEERRELASAGPRQILNLSTEGTLGSPAEAGAARASGPAQGGSSNPSRERNILGSAARGSAARTSSSGTGVTPAARVSAPRASTAEAAATATADALTASPSSGRDRRRNMAPRPAPSGP